LQPVGIVSSKGMALSRSLIGCLVISTNVVYLLLFILTAGTMLLFAGFNFKQKKVFDYKRIARKRRRKQASLNPYDEYLTRQQQTVTSSVVDTTTSPVILLDRPEAMHENVTTGGSEGEDDPKKEYETVVRRTKFANFSDNLTTENTETITNEKNYSPEVLLITTPDDYTMREVLGNSVVNYFTTLKELEVEDKKLMYNRLHDPSQFVFESYAFKRPLTVGLYIYRSVLAFWMILTIILDMVVLRKRQPLDFLSFLTHWGALLFAVYYSLQSIFGLLYITSCYKFYKQPSVEEGLSSHTRKHVTLFDSNPWMKKTFDFVSTIIWLLSEWNLVACVLISCGYWLVIIPDWITHKSSSTNSATSSNTQLDYV